MAVIKANAYGHGLVAVARALDAADAFAVARVDEGLTLRDGRHHKRTVLLEGVFDRGQLDAAAAARVRARGAHGRADRVAARAGAGEPFRIWLKLDSGMNRLGFKGDSFGAALAALSALAARANAGQSRSRIWHRPMTPNLGDRRAARCAFRAATDRARGRAQHRELRRHAGLPRGAGRLGAARAAPLRRVAVRRLDRRGLWLEAAR